MSEEKLKSKPEAMWQLFNDMGNCKEFLEEDYDDLNKKLLYLSKRIEQEIETTLQKISELQKQQSLFMNSEVSEEEKRNLIAEVSRKIDTLEARAVKLKRYLLQVPEYASQLDDKKKKCWQTLKKGRHILKQYLEMLEIYTIQKEFTDYQESNAYGQYHVMNYRGTVFYCNDDVFDVNQTDSEGRTNLQRMENGQAPIGYDGKAVELHHMQQSEKIGGIVEISGTMHKENHGIIHWNGHDIPSGINRTNFAVLREAYWKKRAEFIKRGMYNE